MANDLIVKSNTLINATHYLSLVEQRLIGLAIIKLRQVQITFSDEVMLEVRASDYVEAFGVDRTTAYEALKEATDKLFERQSEYDVFFIKGVDEETPSRITNVPPKTFGSEDFSYTLKGRWVSKVLYEPKQGLALLAFTPDILQHLIDLKSYFTQYYLSQTVELTSSYAFRLFEMVMQWKSVGKTPIIPLEDLRGRLGVLDGKYSEMHNFKKRVLDVAVEQVSKGEYEVTYKQHKSGRSISGIEFFFTKKKKTENKPAQTVPQRDPNVIDMFEGLSDKENQIVKATADKYIAEKGITDLGHKQNIYKKAKEGRWGLADLDKQTAELQAQNIKITEQIQAEKQAQQRQEQEKAEQEKTNKEFIEYFESLPLTQQAEILTEVKAKVEKLPIIGQNFIENMATSYKDVMYRSYFKKVMGLI